MSRHSLAGTNRRLFALIPAATFRAKKSANSMWQVIFRQASEIVVYISSQIYPMSGTTQYRLVSEKKVDTYESERPRFK